MKTRIIFIILGLFLSTKGIANENPINWEETLRVELNKLIGSESFYFDQLDVSVSDKKISGTGTFFGAKDVQFQVSYWSEGQIGNFTAQIPEKAKVAISTRELTQLAGQDLQRLLPKAIS